MCAGPWGWACRASSGLPALLYKKKANFSEKSNLCNFQKFRCVSPSAYPPINLGQAVSAAWLRGSLRHPEASFRKPSCGHPILPKPHQQEDLGERSPKTQTRAPSEARRQGKIHFSKWIAGAAPRTPLLIPSLSSYLPLPSILRHPPIQPPGAHRSRTSITRHPRFSHFSGPIVFSG